MKRDVPSLNLRPSNIRIHNYQLKSQEPEKYKIDLILKERQNKIKSTNSMSCISLENIECIITSSSLFLIIHLLIYLPIP
jgi:hypothetical protein